MTDHDFEPFAHLTAPNVGLYRAVMGAFLRAKHRFMVHMRPEDVCESLGSEYELADLAEAMNKLVGWGNLRADPDTSRVTTVEDFHRARFLYQLTRQGEAAEQALHAYDEALGRRGALQAVALSDIATQLRALLELAEQDERDPAKAHLLLRGRVDRFSDLADNAQAFMGSLQRTLDLQEADAEAFRAYKDRLIDYLERFIKDLVSTGGEIAALVADLDRAGAAGLLELAAWREAEDAAPGADTDNDPRQREFERGRVLWQDRWQGFRSWFVSEGQRQNQAKLLRLQARAAIPRLLQVVSALNERRSGRSDRSADFRSLARWFAEAPDDACMHRLWRAAFGLSSAPSPWTTRPRPSRSHRPRRGPRRHRCRSARGCVRQAATSGAASRTGCWIARNSVSTWPNEPRRRPPRRPPPAPRWPPHPSRRPRRARPGRIPVVPESAGRRTFRTWAWRAQRAHHDDRRHLGDPADRAGGGRCRRDPHTARGVPRSRSPREDRGPGGRVGTGAAQCLAAPDSRTRSRRPRRMSAAARLAACSATRCCARAVRRQRCSCWSASTRRRCASGSTATPAGGSSSTAR